MGQGNGVNQVNPLRFRVTDTHETKLLIFCYSYIWTRQVDCFLVAPMVR